MANSFLKIPVSEFLHLVQVEKKFDGADAYIVDNLDVHDLVITADIPLADHAVKKGARPELM